MNIQPNGLSRQDLYALRRALAQLPTKHLNITHPLVKGICDLDMRDGSVTRTVQTVLQPYIGKIFEIDPNAPPPEPENHPLSTRAYVPPLPAAAQLSAADLKAAEGVGTWYRAALEWCVKRSPMTPVHFLETGLIWLLGLAINRRVCLSLHSDIYPHMYLLIVAESSKYAKTTGMNTVKKLAEACFPHLLIPGSTTPEALMEILSGEKPSNYDKLKAKAREMVDGGRAFPAQRGMMVDEYSGVLAAAKKDYMAGFIELLMKLYDAGDSEQHQTRGSGMLYVEYPAMSIFGATTPAAMARSTSYELWENGALARYLIMFREGSLPYVNAAGERMPPKSLTEPLSHLYNVLPSLPPPDSEGQNFTPIYAEIAPDAHKHFIEYDKVMRFDMLDESLDERLHPNYSRMPTQLLKAALALAVMDWAGKKEKNTRPVISMAHIALAQTIVEKARESLHNLLPVLNMTIEARRRRSILSQLKVHIAGLSVHQLCDQLGAKASDIKEAMNPLLEDGTLEAIEHRPHTGRPTWIYRISDEKGGQKSHNS